MNQVFKAVLIDDEPAARRILGSLLGLYSDLVRIGGEASTGEEAVALIDEQRPDLVFLDIHLPDINGFEVLERAAWRPNVIFTTAYDEYAMKAFEAFSIDYLLKPVSEARLAKAMRKLEQFGKTAAPSDPALLRQAAVQMLTKLPTAFPIRQGDRIILVRFEQIAYLEANDKYISLHTVDGKKYLTDQSLTLLAQKLPPAFLRVQKSYIINRERIREIYKHFNGRFVIVMDDGRQTRITTGLSFYDEIRRELGI